MNIDVTFRGMEPTPALRDHIEERLEHALRHLTQANKKVRIVVGPEDTGYLATIELNAGRTHLNAKAQADDLYEAVNVASDRIARQLDDSHAKKSQHRAH